ncbi:Macrolide export ATP-binding/permease protein MacB [Microbacterium azadirachtae]|uniref:Macrolide export ATP-binding/permease protein MacB n=1 Tax=Microbacterium azadirachtae TaxID=582680 RepID=A0A0F0L173_9MICO|nr:ABC transporter ATP-binding protein [Microbacterium azadirachtae]KJL26877.1 Macrolide export ATP-binding/permease protein MacB [Microbacterium azadirachtae]
MEDVTESLIHAENLHKTFSSAGVKEPRVPVLRGISLDVQPGEMVSIVGPSGSGKSTLLYCLSGLEPADSGVVRLAGRELGTLGRGALATLRRKHVGFVFQSFNLIPSLTARENIALPARLARRRANRASIYRALADVGLADRGGHRPGQLSGGQQQRVAIARVLAMRPDIVFADEPTGSLDTATGSDVLRLLRAAAGDGRSVVVVTHDLEAAALADRVLVLRDGLIHSELRRPTPEQVLEAITLAGAAA